MPDWVGAVSALPALAPECLFPVYGLLAVNLLYALPVAVVLTLATLIAYRWQIGREMRQVGSATEPETARAATAPKSELCTVLLSSDVTPASDMALARQAQRGLRAVSVIYTVAGMTYAAVFASLTFAIGNLELRPLRWTAVWIVHVWPVVPVLMLIAVAGVRRKLSLALAYFVALGLADLAIEATGMRYRPAPGELFILWAATMGRRPVCY
jgi:hypothetical protein